MPSAVHAVFVCPFVRLQIMPHDRPGSLVFKWDVAQSLCIAEPLVIKYTLVISGLSDRATDRTNTELDG